MVLFCFERKRTYREPENHWHCLKIKVFILNNEHFFNESRLEILFNPKGKCYKNKV